MGQPENVFVFFALFDRDLDGGLLLGLGGGRHGDGALALALGGDDAVLHGGHLLAAGLPGQLVVVNGGGGE